MLIYFVVGLNNCQQNCVLSLLGIELGHPRLDVSTNLPKSLLKIYNEAQQSGQYDTVIIDKQPINEISGLRYLCTSKIDKLFCFYNPDVIPPFLFSVATDNSHAIKHIQNEYPKYKHNYLKSLSYDSIPLTQSICSIPNLN